MDSTLIQQIAFCGLLFTGILLVLAILTKFTGGLFWARGPKNFIEDQQNPDHQPEQKIGTSFSQLILAYLPPFFLGFLILLIWFNR